MSGLALAWLLDQEGMLAADRAAASGACDAKPSGPTPFLAKKPHFAPRATSVISLFMSGGVSHVDTFDPKPALRQYAGQPLTGKGEIVVRQGNPGPLMPSPFSFRKYGQSGHGRLGDFSARSPSTWTTWPSCARSTASRTITCRPTS